MAHSTMLSLIAENVDKQTPLPTKWKNLLKDPLVKEHPLAEGSTLRLVERGVRRESYISSFESPGESVLTGLLGKKPIKFLATLQPA